MDKADIEAIKAANPILDVLRDLGIPAQNNRIRCLRPESHAHADRTPSVTIWPDRGQFKCWVCADVKGDVIDLVRLARGCTFREALEYLGKNALGTAPLPPLRTAHPHRPTPVAHPSQPATHLAQPAGFPAPSAAAPAQVTGHSHLFLPESVGAEVQESLALDSQPPVPPQGDPGYTAANGGFAADKAGVPAAFGGFHPANGGFPGVNGEFSAANGGFPAANTSTSEPRPGHDAELEDELLRHRILTALLDACPPVSGKVGQYLQKRRIFKRTWDRQKLRMIEDYGGVSRKLEGAFASADLERLGFFNAAGHLRYYRHKLLFPYLDPQGRPVYMQARAIDAESKPKELSMSGPIPLPYNCRLLDGEPGQIYLCEGVIDTLTLIEQGFPAVGIPGAANFKPAWADLFRNKSVHVAFDPDAPGESGAAKAIERLQAHGIEARRLTPPAGMDLNDWFRRG